jgi:hypothetical protein
MLCSLILVSGLLLAEPSELPLVFEDGFEAGADHWQPTDPSAWRVLETDRGKVYNQFKASDYQPPFRSPYNMALLKDVLVGDFVLTAKVQSTHVDAGAHQDMCLFFGYQDPAHFYYVHLGKTPDAVSSKITLVNGAPRQPITKNVPTGIPWDAGWHEVKIVRRVADGTIEVYFDDMQTPNMIAVDKTFTWGQVGIGSFDDHGNWDDVKLCGIKVEKPQ